MDKNSSSSHKLNHPGGIPDPKFFHEIYKETPSWDISGPQPAFVSLANTGMIRGNVLDVGCGSGENALFFGTRGHDVWGIDMVPIAIQRAREKAAARNIQVTFHVADALHLEDLEQAFDTVTDSGLFHVFSDEDRVRYVRSVSSVIKVGGLFHMLCFSEHTPGTRGPRRVTQNEIHETFEAGWQILNIKQDKFEVTDKNWDVTAWLSSIKRVG